MSEVIMIGCDLHDRSMLLRYSVGAGEVQQAGFSNEASGRRQMITKLKSLAKRHGSDRIVFVYEASGQGYGLSDLLEDHDIECHVLSPSHLPRTAKSAKQKTDAKDAQMLLEQVRGYVLAGNALPVVWTPPKRLRHDRELIRARVDAGDELTRVKQKILSALKRHQIIKPAWSTSGWSKRFVAWLRDVAAKLELTSSAVFNQLIERSEFCHRQKLALDSAILKLSKEDRYKLACRKLREIPGVGLLTAMTFLTEMGDLNRFENRRQVAGYLGLCPASFETGEANNRKGRITRQGSSRLRKMLCQAAWVSIQYCPKSQEDYHRVKQDQPKRTKKAIVALMRKLAIRLWHLALSCGVSNELVGRGGPNELKTFSRAQQRGLSSFDSPSLRP